MTPRSGPLDRLPGHQAKRMYSHPWIACTSPDYLKSRGAPQSPHDLGAHEHVGFRNPASGRLLTWRVAATRGKGVPRVAPKPKHILDDAHAAIVLVGDGFGIDWRPAWLVAEDVRNGRLVEVLARRHSRFPRPTRPPGGERVESESFLIPASAAPRLFAHPTFSPDAVARAMLQAENNFAIEKHEEAAAAMYRRALDVALKIFAPEAGKSIYERIKTLEAEPDARWRSMSIWWASMRRMRTGWTISRPDWK
ncbi:LysR substrate-binding domain-containing protein [Methylocapsa sp. S129]|uniref:LysR substrate-binding domain-containing protein n=1 Tax=Methylocapsa sp. S129 TaxID=1641869 RepID=UPI0021103043|nr:LysR substrate-binding domain-containing protein [Methylocapsa sp. S129]